MLVFVADSKCTLQCLLLTINVHCKNTPRCLLLQTVGVGPAWGDLAGGEGQERDAGWPLPHLQQAQENPAHQGSLTQDAARRTAGGKERGRHFFHLNNGGDVSVDTEEANMQG